MKLLLKKTITVILIITVFSCTKEPLKSSSVQSSTISDESSGQALTTDNNEPGKYTYITIGAQKWMSANLAVTKYRNGDKIPQVRNKAEWAALTTGAWCWYNKDSATGAPYGRLYNWYAVNDPRGLAPTGWHIPSDAEWDTLSNYLGKRAGGKMKATGTIEAGTGLWFAPNTGATNSSGFTGLPGGCRENFGSFGNVGTNGYWWSSTEVGTNGAGARYRFLVYYNGSLSRSYSFKQDGFSVRCVRD